MHLLCESDTYSWPSSPHVNVAFFNIKNSTNDSAITAFSIKKFSFSISHTHQIKFKWIWNIIQLQKGMKLWHKLQHKWTLKKYGKAKKADTKDHILCSSVYMKCLEQTNPWKPKVDYQLPWARRRGMKRDS